MMCLTPDDIDINKAIAICTRSGISVGSIKAGRKFKIKVSDNGVDTVYDQTVYAHRLSSVIKKTWRYYAAKILNDE